MVETNKIDQYLDKAGWYLIDVEDDAKWDDYSILSFSIEWADACGMVKRLIEWQNQMSAHQSKSFENLKRRFEAVAGRLRTLNLENPFAA